MESEKEKDNRKKVSIILWSIYRLNTHGPMSSFYFGQVSEVSCILPHQRWKIRFEGVSLGAVLNLGEEKFCELIILGCN